MKSSRLILISVLLAGVAGVFAISHLYPQSKELVYEGRYLSEWLPALDYSNRDAPGLSPRDAARAVRAAGTNSFPILFRLLRATDSPLKVKLAALIQKHKWVNIHIMTAENLHREAEEAFRLLGSRADAAVPELTRMCDEDLAADSKAAVVNVLAYSVHPTEAALPALQRAATNADASVRYPATNALQNIQTSRQRGIGSLNWMADSILTSLRKKNMPNALQLFFDFFPGENGATASMVPGLLAALKEQPDNYWVKFMLEQADPDAAACILNPAGQKPDAMLSAPYDPPESGESDKGLGNTLHLLAVGDWSAPVKPAPPYTVLRGRLLVYEPAHYTNRSGEWWGDLPIEMELQDQTPALETLPTSACFDYKSGFDCDLRDAQGNRAPRGPAVSESIPAPAWVTVPFDGTVRFRVDRFNVASRTKPDGTLIQLGTNSWRIPAGDANTWFLSATFTPLTNSPNPIDYPVWSGNIKLPPVKISPVKP